MGEAEGGAMTDFRQLESRARDLCEARHGPGSWEAKHRKRAFFRERAQRDIERANSVSTADALLSIFGYRRAK